MQYRILFICLLALLIPALTHASAYNIEVVLFERYSGGGEAWSTHPGSPDFGLAEANLSKASSDGIRLLSGKSLEGVAHTLRKKGLKVHAHVRWRQDVPKRNNKRWLRIGSAKVGGLISISRGRYLHLNTDLLIRHQGAAYRVKSGRRMRGGELHYLDHPKIGLIAIAEKVRTQPERAAPAPVNVQNTTPPEQPEAEQGAPESTIQNSIPRTTPDRS